jgi:hypothetical protein
MFQIFLGHSRHRLLSPSLFINLGLMKLSVAPESTKICLLALCHGSVGKSLDSAVMTTQAESSISHGLIHLVVLGC